MYTVWQLIAAQTAKISWAKDISRRSLLLISWLWAVTNV